MERAMNKIVIVSQKTRLQELVERFNTKEQAQFYIEHLGGSFKDYLDEDREYVETLSLVQKISVLHARVANVEKKYLFNYIFGAEDVVICVGRDGLVCNTMKYLSETNLVIGVNPDPKRWEGVVLPFQAKDLAVVLPLVCKEKERLPRKKLHLHMHALRMDRSYMQQMIFLLVRPVTFQHDMRLIIGGRLKNNHQAE